LPRPYFDVNSKSRTAALAEEAKARTGVPVKKADSLVQGEVTSSETNGKVNVPTVTETKGDTLLGEIEHISKEEANGKTEIPVHSAVKDNSVVSSD